MKNKILLLSILSVFFFLKTTNLYSQSNKSSPWNNPVLIEGSSFGNFFQSLYKIGDYDEMIRFTSEKSIKKYSVDSIKRYYQSVDFGYEMKLKSRVVHQNFTVLNYESIILVYKSMLGSKYDYYISKPTKLYVVVENDTCRLLLDNTLFNLGITWDIANTK